MVVTKQKVYKVVLLCTSMKKIKNAIAKGLLAGSLLFGAPSCKRSNGVGMDSRQPVKDNYAQEQVEKRNELRETALSYLSQPRFSNANLLEQLSGTKAELQMYDLGEGNVYFSIPEEHNLKESLEKLSSNPNAVEFGKNSEGKYNGGRLELGDYIFNRPGNYFFRFPSKDFKVDENTQINIPYKSANYSIDMQELQDFSNNKNIYGGYIKADTGTGRNGRVHVIANHGAFVARKGESSLERLVDSLTENESTVEGKTQKLLDFVTNEIKYNYSEANSDMEVLKRPNEVLMTGSSDCSGKAILYASLLEQTDADYLLVYMDGHITTAVKGDYGNWNGLGFKMGNKSYSIAEPTARGFQIGCSRLGGNLGVKDIKYLQRPGEDSKIYDVKTGEALLFR